MVANGGVPPRGSAAAAASLRRRRAGGGGASTGGVNTMLQFYTDSVTVLQVHAIQPDGGLDNENTSYYFTIECESCGSISEEEVRLCKKEEFLVPDPIWGEGETTNLVYECNVCGKTGTILMVSGKGHPLPSLFGETGSYTTIMVFNCDGVKPVRFSLDKFPWEAQCICTSMIIRLSQ